MDYKKLISLGTLFSFLLSSVFAPAAQGVSRTRNAANQLQEGSESLLIPSDAGRITDIENFGGKKVVINIQDLHCHPEVQRNIARILSALDKKYRLRSVFVEGGHGDVNTSWLCGIKDKDLKAEITENLIDQGKLTGGEYYSVISGQPDLLKGIEEEKIHTENIMRLGALLKRKSFNEAKLKELDKDLAIIKARYFNARNRELNRLIEKHRAGRVPDEKYYAFLVKYAETINKDPEGSNNIFVISTDNYPALRSYLSLTADSRQLNHKRILRQLQQFTRFLKTRLPYSVYNTLLETTENFSRIDTLYLALSGVAREYELKLEIDFPDLKRFLDYSEKSRNINPIEIIAEERKLVEEIRVGLSRNISELEVSFLADYYSYFRDYLSHRLSADDYEYFIQRFDKFKTVWGKYAVRSRLDELSPAFALLDDYYKANFKRNYYFLENIPALSEELRGLPYRSQDDDAGLPAQDLPVFELLKGSEIIVIITGGFHTQGLKELLQKLKISHLTITPHVTQDTRLSSQRYEELAREQAYILSQTLQLELASQLSSPALFKLVIGAANRRLAKAGIKDREALVEEIEESLGVNARFDPKSGIITFDNGAQIRLETKPRYVEAEGIKAGKFVSDAVKASTGALIDQKKLVAAMTRALTGDPIAFLKIVMTFAAKNHLIAGSGIIFDIANDPELGDKTAIAEIPIEILAEFPADIQRILLQAARNQSALAGLNSESGTIVQSLIAIDMMRPYIAATARKEGIGTAQTADNNKADIPLTLPSSRILSAFLQRHGIAFAPLLAAARALEELFVAPWKELAEFIALFSQYSLYANYGPRGKDFRSSAAVRQFYQAHGYDPDNQWSLKIFADGLLLILTDALIVSRPFGEITWQVKASLMRRHFAYNLSNLFHRRGLPLTLHENAGSETARLQRHEQLRKQVLADLPKAIERFLSREPSQTADEADLAFEILEKAGGQDLSSQIRRDEAPAILGKLRETVQEASFKSLSKNKRSDRIADVLRQAGITQATGRIAASLFKGAAGLFTSHGAAHRVDVIGLFDPHAFEQGFKEIEPALTRIVDIAARQGRPVVLIIEDHGSPESVLLTLNNLQSTPAQLRKAREAFLGATPLAQLAFKQNQEEERRVLSSPRQIIFDGAGVERTLPPMRYRRMLQEFIYRNGTVEVVKERVTYQGWLPAAQREVYNFDAQLAIAMGRPVDFERAVRGQPPLLHRAWDVRDQEVRRQIDEIARRAPDAVVVVLRGSAHHRMLDKLDRQKFRSLSALTDVMMDPADYLPTEYIANQLYRNGNNRPLTGAEEKYLVAALRAYLAIAGSLQDGRSINSLAALKARIAQAVSRAVPQTLLDQLRTEGGMDLSGIRVLDSAPVNISFDLPTNQSPSDPHPLTLPSSRILCAFLQRHGVTFSPFIAAAHVIEELFIAPWLELQLLAAYFPFYVSDPDGFKNSGAVRQLYEAHEYDNNDANAYELFSSGMLRMMQYAFMANPYGKITWQVKMSLLVSHFFYNFSNAVHRRNLSMSMDKDNARRVKNKLRLIQAAVQCLGELKLDPVSSPYPSARAVDSVAYRLNEYIEKAIGLALITGSVTRADVRRLDLISILKEGPVTGRLTVSVPGNTNFELKSIAVEIVTQSLEDRTSELSILLEKRGPRDVPSTDLMETMDFADMESLKGDIFLRAYPEGHVLFSDTRVLFEEAKTASSIGKVTSGELPAEIISDDKGPQRLPIETLPTDKASREPLVEIMPGFTDVFGLSPDASAEDVRKAVTDFLWERNDYELRSAVEKLSQLSPAVEPELRAKVIRVLEILVFDASQALNRRSQDLLGILGTDPKLSEYLRNREKRADSPASMALASSRALCKFLLRQKLVFSPLLAAARVIDELFFAPIMELSLFSDLCAKYILDQSEDKTFFKRDVNRFFGDHYYTPFNNDFDFFYAGMLKIMEAAASSNLFGINTSRLSLVWGHFRYNWNDRKRVARARQQGRKVSPTPMTMSRAGTSETGKNRLIEEALRDPYIVMQFTRDLKAAVMDKDAARIRFYEEILLTVARRHPERVCRALIDALKAYELRQRAKELIARIGDDFPRAVMSAFKAHFKGKDPLAIRYLSWYLGDDSMLGEGVREVYFNIMKDNRQNMGSLIGALGNRDESTVRAAQGILARICEQGEQYCDFPSPLIAALSDANYRKAQAAAHVLVAMYYMRPELEPTIRGCLNDEHQQVQTFGSEILWAVHFLNYPEEASSAQDFAFIEDLVYNLGPALSQQAADILDRHGRSLQAGKDTETEEAGAEQVYGAAEAGRDAEETVDRGQAALSTEDEAWLANFERMLDEVLKFQAELNKLSALSGKSAKDRAKKLVVKIDDQKTIISMVIRENARLVQWYRDARVYQAGFRHSSDDRQRLELAAELAQKALELQTQEDRERLAREERERIAQEEEARRQQEQQRIEAARKEIAIMIEALNGMLASRSQETRTQQPKKGKPQAQIPTPDPRQSEIDRVLETFAAVFRSQPLLYLETLEANKENGRLYRPLMRIVLENAPLVGNDAHYKVLLEKLFAMDRDAVQKLYRNRERIGQNPALRSGLLAFMLALERPDQRMFLEYTELEKEFIIEQTENDTIFATLLVRSRELFEEQPLDRAEKAMLPLFTVIREAVARDPRKLEPVARAVAADAVPEKKSLFAFSLFAHLMQNSTESLVRLAAQEDTTEIEKTTVLFAMAFDGFFSAANLPLFVRKPGIKSAHERIREVIAAANDIIFRNRSTDAGSDIEENIIYFSRNLAGFLKNRGLLTESLFDIEREFNLHSGRGEQELLSRLADPGTSSRERLAIAYQLSIVWSRSLAVNAATFGAIAHKVTAMRAELTDPEAKGALLFALQNIVAPGTEAAKTNVFVAEFEKVLPQVAAAGTVDEQALLESLFLLPAVPPGYANWRILFMFADLLEPFTKMDFIPAGDSGNAMTEPREQIIGKVTAALDTAAKSSLFQNIVPNGNLIRDARWMVSLDEKTRSSVAEIILRPAIRKNFNQGQKRMAPDELVEHYLKEMPGLKARYGSTGAAAGQSDPLPASLHVGILTPITADKILPRPGDASVPMTLSSSRIFSRFLIRNKITFQPFLAVARALEELFVAPFAELADFTALYSRFAADPLIFANGDAVREFYLRHSYDAHDKRAYTIFTDGLLTIVADALIASQPFGRVTGTVRRKLVTGHFFHNLKNLLTRRGLPLTRDEATVSDEQWREAFDDFLNQIIKLSQEQNKLKGISGKSAKARLAKIPEKIADQESAVLEACKVRPALVQRYIDRLANPSGFRLTAEDKRKLAIAQGLQAKAQHTMTEVERERLAQQERQRLEQEVLERQTKEEAERREQERRNLEAARSELKARITTLSELFAAKSREPKPEQPKKGKPQAQLPALSPVHKEIDRQLEELVRIFVQFPLAYLEKLATVGDNTRMYRPLVRVILENAAVLDETGLPPFLEKLLEQDAGAFQKLYRNRERIAQSPALRSEIFHTLLAQEQADTRMLPEYLELEKDFIAAQIADIHTFEKFLFLAGRLFNSLPQNKAEKVMAPAFNAFGEAVGQDIAKLKPVVALVASDRDREKKNPFAFFLLDHLLKQLDEPLATLIVKEDLSAVGTTAGSFCAAYDSVQGAANIPSAVKQSITRSIFSRLAREITTAYELVFLNRTTRLAGDEESKRVAFIRVLSRHLHWKGVIQESAFDIEDEFNKYEESSEQQLLESLADTRTTTNERLAIAYHLSVIWMIGLGDGSLTMDALIDKVLAARPLMSGAEARGALFLALKDTVVAGEDDARKKEALSNELKNALETAFHPDYVDESALMDVLFLLPAMPETFHNLPLLIVFVDILGMITEEDFVPKELQTATNMPRDRAMQTVTSALDRVSGSSMYRQIVFNRDIIECARWLTTLNESDRAGAIKTVLSPLVKTEFGANGRELRLGALKEHFTAVLPGLKERFKTPAAAGNAVFGDRDLENDAINPGIAALISRKTDIPWLEDRIKSTLAWIIPDVLDQTLSLSEGAIVAERVLKNKLGTRPLEDALLDLLHRTNLVFLPAPRGMFTANGKFAAGHFGFGGTAAGHQGRFVYLPLTKDGQLVFLTDELAVIVAHELVHLLFKELGLRQLFVHDLAENIHQMASEHLFGRLDAVDDQFERVKGRIERGEPARRIPIGIKTIGARNIIVVRGDLTAMDTDAIVNPTTPEFEFGIGVSGSIKRRGGEEITTALHGLAPIREGGAVFTFGGNLKAEYVIHAAVANVDYDVDPSVVRRATENSLKTAQHLDLKTIAFPPFDISGGMTSEECARIMLDAIDKHLRGNTSLENVVLVLPDEAQHEVFVRELVSPARETLAPGSASEDIAVGDLIRINNEEGLIVQIDHRRSAVVYLPLPLVSAGRSPLKLIQYDDLSLVEKVPPVSNPRAPFNPGDKVEVFYDGEWIRATIVATGAERYDLLTYGTINADLSVYQGHRIVVKQDYALENNLLRKVIPGGGNELVLPRNLPQAVKALLGGTPAWQVALDIAFDRERFETYNPAAFYRSHQTGWARLAGTVLITAGNYLPVFGGFFLAPALLGLPLLSVAGFAIGLEASILGYAAGYLLGGLVHTLWDTFNLRKIEADTVSHIAFSEQLPARTARYRNSPAFTHIWYADLPEHISEDRGEQLSPIGFNATYSGRRIDTWAGVRNGALVFYLDLRKTGIPREEYGRALSQAAAQISRYLGGTDTLSGDRIAAGRVRDIGHEGQMENARRIRFKPRLLVDHIDGSDLIKRDFSGLGMNQAPVISPELPLTAQNPADTNMLIHKLLIRHAAVSQTFAENKILQIDVPDLNAFINDIRFYTSQGKGQMLVDWRVFEKENQSRVKEFLDLARSKDILVYFNYVAEPGKDNDKTIARILDLGCPGIGLDLTSYTGENLSEALALLGRLSRYPVIGIKADFDLPEESRANRGFEINVTKDLDGNLTINPIGRYNYTSEEVIDVRIQARTGTRLTEVELNEVNRRVNDIVTRLPLRNTMIFHSADLRWLIETSRDIDYQKAFSFFGTLLNFGAGQIDTREQARRLGYNWDAADLSPLLPAEKGVRQVWALLSGEIEGSGITADVAIFDQYDKLATWELRSEYLAAIAGKMLIVDTLANKDKNLAREYRAGKFRFDPLDEETLGAALVRQFLMSPDAAQDDRRASTAVKERIQAHDIRSAFLELSGKALKEQPEPGTVTALIDLLLMDVLSDYGMRKSIRKKHGNLNPAALRMIMGAA